MKALEKIGDFVSKYMAVLVILMAGAAMTSPQTFAGIAPHVALSVSMTMTTTLLGNVIGFALSKALHMDMAKAKAVAIEVGMQNSGLAASLAMLHFGAAAAIPGAIFSVWHNISGSLAANYLSGRQEADQKKA